MKKIICMVLALMLCMSLCLPVMAQEFVPSVTYKGGPNITSISFDGGDFEHAGKSCVVVTNVQQARNKTTDITQEERDALIEAYEALENGEMTLPSKAGYVVRELVDISFKYDACRQIPEHGDKPAWLAKEGNTVTLTFRLNQTKNADIVVLAYVGGSCVEVETTNNGNGTITCVFEDFCPVAFLTGSDAASSSPNTGDAMAQSMGLWIGLMAVCAAGVVALVIGMNRKRA